MAELLRGLTLAAHTAIAARGVCTLAIPGGSVANAVLPWLAGANWPWSQVHVFWCDERAVPATDNDSNAGRAMMLVADSPLALHAHLHPMRGDANDLAAAAEHYEHELNTVCGHPPVLDVLLLGVGEDGHIASMFPGHASLNELHRAVVVVRNAPKTPAVRLSLTMPVLLRAREIIVVALGVSKANALHSALENVHDTSPLSRIIREANRVCVLLDADAAGRLIHTTLEPLE